MEESFLALNRVNKSIYGDEIIKKCLDGFLQLGI